MTMSDNMTSTINTLSRSPLAKDQIKKLWSKPIIVDDFLSEQEMNELKSSILTSEKIHRHSSYENELEVRFLTKEKLPPILFQKLEIFLKSFSIKSIFAFDSNKPFMLHTDSGLRTDTLPYKNITFCLEKNSFSEQLVLYNAFGYFSTSITDFDSFAYSKEVVENYNYLLATPEEFVNSENCYIPKEHSIDQSNFNKNQLLAHIPSKLTSHFSIADVIEFKYNRLIIFDSCQLHSGSALKSVYLSEKMKRMTIFTEIFLETIE